MSGSTFQCSTARNLPVRPRPVWISSATNSVPYFRQSSAAAQIVWRGHVNALALDRLDEEGRDVAAAQRLFERGEIVEWDFLHAGQQGPEPLPERLVAVHRQRAVGQPWSMVAIDEAGTPCRRAREFHRGLDRLRAELPEESPCRARAWASSFSARMPEKHRDVHLHQIGQVGVEHADERRERMSG